MKKLLAIFTLLVLAGTTAFSQVQINPKIGYNVYDISDEQGTFKADGKSGFHAGVDFRIGDAIYVQPGIHYYAMNVDFEGIVKDDGNIDNVVKENVNQQNLRIPVVIGTSFLNTDNFALRAFVGGAAFVPIGVGDNIFGIDKEDYKPVTIGATVGAGLDIGRITVDLNYDFGISDAFEDDAIINYNGKSNVLSLSLGYLF